MMEKLVLNIAVVRSTKKTSGGGEDGGIETGRDEKGTRRNGREWREGRRVSPGGGERSRRGKGWRRWRGDGHGRLREKEWKKNGIEIRVLEWCGLEKRERVEEENPFGKERTASPASLPTNLNSQTAASQLIIILLFNLLLNTNTPFHSQLILQLTFTYGESLW